nr:neprilysin-1-like [Parasteatoda tepidariorum]
MLNDQWSEEGYVWYRHLAEVNRGLFKDIIFDFDFLPFLNNSEEYIIKLNKGKCLFDSIWFRTDENSTTNYTDAARTYIVGFALLLGSERDLSSLEAEADAVIDFDYKIHKTVDLEYYPSMYSIKMEEINSWGNGTISYLDYINFHLPEDYPADNNTYLYMKMLDYFEYNLPEVILGANTKTIANYISFYMVSTFSKFASEDLLTLRNEFLSSIGIEFNMSDEQVCMTHIKSFMPDAVGRMYIDNYFPRLTEMHVQKMVDMIKLAYSSTLDQNVWMDKNTLLYALVKLQSIEMAIGYNSWISDDGLLNKHYEKVERVKDNGYLNVIIAFYETLSENSYGRWNRTVKKYEVYDEEPLYVINAFYGPQANFMLPSIMELLELS